MSIHHQKNTQDETSIKINSLLPEKSEDYDSFYKLTFDLERKL